MEEDQPQRFVFFHSQNSSIVSKPIIFDAAPKIETLDIEGVAVPIPDLRG